MTAVGIVVNPLAGKDIRRLVTNASPVSDATKIGQVRRVAIGALEAGASEVVVCEDHHRLAARATEGVDPVRALDLAPYGDRTDTVRAATAMREAGVGAVVVLGGDGTHRDVASGWPDVTMVALSTGTNNVFPRSWDATSAGIAAGLVAAGRVEAEAVVRRAKRLDVLVHGRDATGHDVALVDVALLDGEFVGARAVWSPERIRSVIAAIAEPASTGLSSIAGMSAPLDRWEPIGTFVELGPGGRVLRLPLSPGSFVDVGIAGVTSVAPGASVRLDGPGVLTLDGERTHVLRRGHHAEVTLAADGPWVVDVDRAVRAGAAARCFDRRAPSGTAPP